MSYNNKINNNFCILFTFLIKKNKNKIEYNYNQNIFNIYDLNKKEFLSLFIKEEKLYMRYFSKQLNEIKLLDNLIYNKYYSFFFYLK